MNSALRDDYYRLIFLNSLDAILLTSPDGRVHRANPAACKMFQRTEEEIIEAGRAGLVDCEDPRLAPALREREEKKKISTELTFIRKDGSKFPVYLTSALFDDDDGNTWTAMIVRDITQEKQAEQDLISLQENTARSASCDYLTGVNNRRGLIANIEKEMDRTRRNGPSMGLLMIDVDRFKQINDRYGHLAGDKVLKRFADAVASQIRPYDLLGRYGGDEFSVCLPNTDKDTALVIAERIRQYIEGLEIRLNGIAIQTTCSIGVVIYRSDSQENIDSLISQVDINMYMAKVRKNHVCGPDGV